MQSNSKKFTFDGGAATYLGTAILGFLITIFSLGICYPFAVVLRQRWRAKHSYIDGKQLIFTGSAVGLLVIGSSGLYSSSSLWVSTYSGSVHEFRNGSGKTLISQYQAPKAKSL